MATIYLGPFRNELRKKQNELAQHMMKGFTAMQLAVDRKTIELMEADLAQGQSAFEYLFQPSSSAKGAPAFRWGIDTELLAEKKLLPSFRDSAGYDRQTARFKQYADQLRSNVDKPYKYFNITSHSVELWVIRRNLPTREVVRKVASELEYYIINHAADEDILRIWPQDAISKILSEDRIDLQMMLRLATSLPNEIQVYTIRQKDEDADAGIVFVAQQALSTILYAIPFVGNAVAAFEVWRGKDIWGNDLSDLDRGVLAASILVPLAFRAVKAGRALYTSERMVRLYGEDARQWSYALAMGERVSADAVGLRRIEEANGLVEAEKPLVRTAAEKLADTFKSLGLDSVGKAIKPVTIDAKLEAIFQRIVAKHPKLAGLDALAMERIVAKGAVEGHVKGQLLEELLEESVVKFLKDPYGRVALGLGDIKGSLYFIPGHLIRDEFGLQLTDGMIVRFVKDRLHAVAVFEAKSGEASARGLAAKSTSIKELSKADKSELLAEAEESIRDLQERARINGLPPPTATAEDQMKLIKQTQQGGQIRSDVERLSELKVWINGRELPVELAVGPRSTKWFGVLPSDVKGSAIKQAIIDAGIPNVEILGMDINQSELITAAKTIIKEMAAFMAP